jgi:hypothetical protein
MHTYAHLLPHSSQKQSSAYSVLRSTVVHDGSTPIAHRGTGSLSIER